MTIQYKNQGYKQASTGKTTVLTCPTDATIIIKSIYCSNNDGSSAILVNMNLVDSSDSNVEYEFFRDDIAAKTQVNASPQGLNLEWLRKNQSLVLIITISVHLKNVLEFTQKIKIKENHIVRNILDKGVSIV